MNKLVLTPEQALLVRQSVVQMIVLDPTGELLGFFNLPLTPDRVAELKRRAKEGPFLTSAEFFADLEQLDDGAVQESDKPIIA
jgi:hypothetical protein